jgi:cation:H+ antiporter
MKKHFYTILFFAIASLPGTILRLAGIEFTPPVMAAISGLSIMSASFLLLWACDAAQSDISQALALAVVALIAVLPEYAVDMYFTWQAGQYPESNYAHYAIANMTGANRLLIGVAWALIAVIFLIRYRKNVHIDEERRTELLFLGMATAYAFIIPIKGSLAWYDGLVFLGLYIWYLRIAGGRPCEESEAEGPAELLIQLPKVKRRLATAGIFLFSALTILANAEPFCENLVATGKVLGINEFFLVQWLAPVASEAPEFIVALSFAWQGRGNLALGTLLSSKLNQWTLLVGMIPGVFALSSRQLGYPLPMDNLQMHEILLTAAQSLLGVVMLASLQLSWRGALLLFVLFSGQLILPPIITAYPSISLGLAADKIHPLFSALYVIAATLFFIWRPKNIQYLGKGLQILPGSKTC